jgi:hypothetical protein
LVVQSDPEKRLKVNYQDVVGIGTTYISPHGLSKAENIEIIWDSLEETSN